MVFWIFSILKSKFKFKSLQEMKKLFLCCFLWSLIGYSIAQLPNGSIAPDFTVTDVNGKSHNLYSYLDEGKSVFLDFFGAWCGPCWSHHQGGAFEDLYNIYGPNGTDEIMVIMVEVDARTNVNCLYGPSGCTYGTQGDWVTGTSHPLADDPSLNSLYNVNYFPTIYGVCPNKILTELGRMSTSGYYNWHLSSCALELDLVAKENTRCFESEDGRIEVKAKKGRGTYTYNWSNGGTGDKIQNVPAGEYFCTVSDGGKEVVGGPYLIEQPEELVFSYFQTEDPSCQNGNGGSIELDVEGGTPNYQALWNDGVESFNRSGLEAGTYRVTVEDIMGCQLFSMPVTFQEIMIPEADITTDTAVCESNILSLSVREADLYEWSTGEDTRSIDVNVSSSETYYVTVTYSSGCKREDSVYVEAIELPIYDDNRMMMMNCQDDVLRIAPTDSEVSSFDYSWESLDGSDLSGVPTDQYDLEVRTPGIYQVTVRDNLTGCEGTSVIAVEPDENLPKIDFSVNGEITCINNQVEIDARASSHGSAFQHSWTSIGDNKPIDNANTLNPTISRPGVYNLTIVNTEFGCDNSKNIEIGIGTLKAPDISIGHRVEGDQVYFYNSSKFKADHLLWSLPDGSSRGEREPQMNRSDLADKVTVCLAAENICGQAEYRCQTIDLTDEDYYFRGVLVDQFDEPLKDVRIKNGILEAQTNTSGSYSFESIRQNSDVLIQPDMVNYQSDDVNEADLSELLSFLLNEDELDSKYIEYAADINEDGKISTADLVILRQYLLSGFNAHSLGAWMIRDRQCAESTGKDIQLDCNPYIELKQLQSSQLSNDFIAIQKGDLSKRDNGILFLGVRKSAIDVKQAKGSIQVALLDNRILSLELFDLSNKDKIYINGKSLTEMEYVRVGDEIKILKIFQDDRSHVQVDVLNTADRQGQMMNMERVLEVSPNPVQARAQVYFESNRSGKAEWTLYNATTKREVNAGVKVLEKGVNRFDIATSSLKSGVYMLVLRDEAEIFNTKLIVQN